MKKIINVFVGLIAVVMLALVSGAVYTIDETMQVVITQFGKPIGEPITEAGLHFKRPFIQKAHYFEKRLLEWDGDPNQIPTKDKKYIWVDATARWKIADALKYLQSVGSETNAQARLDDIVNSATRDAITGHRLVEAVRNTNDILQTKEIEEDTILTDEALDTIKFGREVITREIIEKARRLAPQYGIELVDVRLKRINYVENVRKKVYERMIAERRRAAEKYRSEGQGKRAEIEGQMEKELKLITSEAYRKAEILKGKADAKTTDVYARAYSQDPEFYSFFKTLETYRKTVDDKTTIILTTDSDYYSFLKGLGKAE
ncbi:MAG: protease modulator HflC [Candidatus Omnitrophota bacterium]